MMDRKHAWVISTQQGAPFQIAELVEPVILPIS